ncbi:hypothetical protein MUO83_02800 [Candidatus Bathyarchaeota archaeon]|nr:hypothetical protein [Candidatus Bathyarchaeota archaeon]
MKKEFELLEQREKVLEEKLQSGAKVSRGRLQALNEFASTDNEYDALLTDIERKTVELKEKFSRLEKVTAEFYFKGP